MSEDPKYWNRFYDISYPVGEVRITEAAELCEQIVTEETTLLKAQIEAALDMLRCEQGGWDREVALEEIKRIASEKL